MTAKSRAVKPYPSFDELHLVLRCDPETGKLFWKSRRGARAMPGSEAGSTSRRDGYRMVRFDWKQCMVHRIVWIMCGNILRDELEIDHINGDRSDNRIANLREATRGQNAANVKMLKRVSSTGCPNVYHHKGGRFQAQTTVSGRRVHLGLFFTLEEASGAAKKAARDQHGEFAISR